VVQRAHAVEQVGRRRPRGPSAGTGERAARLGDGRVDRLGGGVGVPDRRHGPRLDQRGQRSPGADDAVDLGRERHGHQVPARGLGDPAHEVRVTGEHVRRVLRPAPCG
jgi:hypothetical protein